ncbi:VCBS repeat-containing protein [Streptomyces sp. YIM 98790]|uniref:FG-GAP repeat domain-containing protein n=1 Tax=Streptomyces sp. YIM 98790 TaxID=2689077 RepID=UPI00140A0DF7|nr:VCBS repeat-containing protein [Streptomyces sp. YIM 98790]
MMDGSLAAWAAYFRAGDGGGGGGGDGGMAHVRELYREFQGFFPDSPGSHTALAGDVDGDGYQDLVTAEGSHDSRLTLYYGGPQGPAGDREPVFLDRAALGLPRDAHTDEADSRGWSFSLADATGDGYADLALGIAHIPGADGSYARGQVVFVPGSPGGPDASRVRQIDLDSPGVPGDTAGHWFFGRDVQLLPAAGPGRVGGLAVAATVFRGQNDDVTVMPVVRGGPLTLLSRQFTAADFGVERSFGGILAS